MAKASATTTTEPMHVHIVLAPAGSPKALVGVAGAAPAGAPVPVVVTVPQDVSMTKPTPASKPATESVKPAASVPSEGAAIDSKTASKKGEHKKAETKKADAKKPETRKPEGANAEATATVIEGKVQDQTPEPGPLAPGVPAQHIAVIEAAVERLFPGAARVRAITPLVARPGGRAPSPWVSAGRTQVMASHRPGTTRGKPRAR